ncbi:protein kinase domain-containing protein [Streptomyces sp. ODS05-4]|uniref:protein kinase domain-containing protein n=1 Tax=Streptomyces sp. ODS05-4 TaxID=2944939 RepID=UPI00210B87FC|nr:protein kinase [Streptomyces sp. ODS05-4]
MDTRPHMQSIGDGRYTIRRELGRGGMAAVYLAHDSVLDRHVAVKLLHPELSHDASFRERFRREAKTVAGLNHPNIVAVFDSGEEEVEGRHVHYIVMEYVEGQSLRDLLLSRSGRPMELSTALDLTAEILTALQASHELGLVHRDVKPANVMVTRRGSVKVMDFGIARALQSQAVSMTQTGAIVGTPQYLSPEQALGRAVDPRSDLYAVGCLLFEILTGTVPFDGDSALGIAYAHVQEVLRTPSTLNPSLPHAADALVHRAMQKDPAARFPDAAAMLRAVRDAGNAPAYGSAPTQGFVAPAFDRAPTLHATPQPYPAPPYGGPVPTWTAAPPAGGPAGPGRSKLVPLLAGVAVAVVLAVTAWALLPSDDPGAQPRGDDLSASATTGEPSADASAGAPTGEPSTTPTGVRTGSPTLTMSPSECRQAPLADGSVPVPFFKLKHIDSARTCAAAGGWTLIERKQDEGVWGKGIVVNQDPYAGFVNEQERTVTVWVSTGHQ